MISDDCIAILYRKFAQLFRNITALLFCVHLVICPDSFIPHFKTTVETRNNDLFLEFGV